ncbi:MAG: caspase family protein [Armatimonadetes bacterium]|nr:caspase family protein [Armatimonadota bacterium]
MANWAIVIGIDRYWRPERHLKGAVSDALKVREWLTDVNGGAVPSRNLTLLVSPTSNGSQIPPGVTTLDATRDNIVAAIAKLLQISNGQGDRFFFYYSGHGLNCRRDFANENAIVPSDFTDLHTDKALSLKSIYELFRATQFSEQFFIVDGCRNIPWETEFRIGDYPHPRKSTPPVPPQFIMYATSPGLTATQVIQAGDARGAFTEALLDGLHGQGIAKVWDEVIGQYVLRWENLFRYVEAQVASRKLEAGGEFIQVPRQDGEHGSENPELARFSGGSFPQEHLDVELEPSEAVHQAEVVVGDLGGVIQQKSGITQVPVRFDLEPRTYSVRAGAPGYRSEKRFYPVHLYGQKTVPVRLVKAAATPIDIQWSTLDYLGPGGPALHPHTVSPPTAPMANLTKGLGEPPTPGTVELRSRDPLAKLELADDTGRIIASGQEALQVEDLAPGFYRGRLVTPEGDAIDHLIELTPGEREEVLLRAPLPPDSELFRQVAETAGFDIESDNTIRPSEATGPAAMLQVSTILALAAGAANEVTYAGEKLGQIGVTPFHDIAGPAATSGVQIVLGVEGSTPNLAGEYVSQIRLGCWRQSESPPGATQPPALSPSQPGLGQYAWDKDPGPYWLSIEAPGQRAVALAITVLPDRVALIVFHRDAGGDVSIHHYLPSLAPDCQEDPRTGIDLSFPLLRRSELIQRSYSSGRLEEPDRYAAELLYLKWIEPIAGCLGGYIMLRTNPTRDLLKIAVGNMTSHFGDLSDSHVLKADYLAAKGQESQSAETFAKALDHGLPVVSEGLVRLVDGVHRHQIDHPAVPLFEEALRKRVRGLLWTAVPVEDLGSV